MKSEGTARAKALWQESRLEAPKRQSETYGGHRKMWERWQASADRREFEFSPRSHEKPWRELKRE